MNTKKNNKKYHLISILSVISFLAIWELCTDILHLAPTHSLPSFITVAKQLIIKFYTKAPDGATLLTHIWSSLKIALVGFVAGTIVGVPLGILTGWYKKFDMVFKPIFDIIRPIPPISWIPIMILFLGIGVGAKSGVIFLSAVIPTIINSYAGIKQTKAVHLWVAQTFGATNLQMLFRVAIPTALPMIFTGLKVSLGAAWMTLVAAELLASNSGLGYMIQYARSIGRADIILVGMIVMAVIGSALAGLLELIEKRIVRG